MPGWYFPDDIPKDTPAGTSESTSEPPPRPSAAREPPQAEHPRRRRTHYSPRQCRICLETVLPTTHAPSESLPGFLQSAPNVTYEDESGRLIRPCNCKGSSKYVHEACLQAWRHADPSYGRRNYWQCPTCGFKYRLARLGAGRWIGSVGMSSLFRSLPNPWRQQILTEFHSCPDCVNCSDPLFRRILPWFRCRSDYQHVCRPLELSDALGKLSTSVLLRG
jgi:hypothetical protein